MLQASPTKRGTGIVILGDYADLVMLYEIVHTMATSLDAENEYQKGKHQLLMNFAYEIRKAYQEHRLIEKVEYLDGKSLDYYGFQLVWTDILVFSYVLRECAGYLATSKREQSTLYMLEHIIEAAAMEYDAVGGQCIREFIGAGIFLDKYAFLLYQALHIHFLTRKGGISRFRNIPLFIRSYFNQEPSRKEVISSFELSAAEQNCKAVDLEHAHFPEIKW
jgi:hypothetical protein